MIIASLAILARTEGFDYSKLAGFIFFFLVWGIGAVASAVNKAKQEAERRRMRGQLSAPTPPPSVVLRSVLPNSAPASRLVPIPVRSPAGATNAPGRKMQKRRKIVSPMPPRGVTSSAPQLPNTRAPAVPEASVQTTPPARTTGATAPAIQRWLRPEVLRRQFILTEILQPPLALRDEPHRQND